MPLGSISPGGGGGGGSSAILLTIMAIDRATAELQKISKEVGALNQNTESAGASGDKAAGGMGNMFNMLKGGITAVAGVTLALQQVGKAFEAVMQAGEEGAAFNQTIESFNQMTESVGVSRDLLYQLRDAAKGTVPDMQLMSYATTALAGASGAFGEQMGSALPQILEIAKAANKANPALGSVDYQFQSLIIGLKRLSPRLIDNTGLQIKLGAAYEEMAKKLGKNREELTSNEQQQALLNATLEAGGRLMTQVGGSADSMTDPFNRLKTAVSNVTTAMKADMAPALAEVADWLAKQISAQYENEQAVRRQEVAIRESAASYDDYVVALRDAGQETQTLDGIQYRYLNEFLKIKDALDEAEEKYGTLTVEIIKNKIATGELSQEQGSSLIKMVNTREAAEDIIKSLGGLSQSEYDASAATSEFAVGMGDLAVASEGAKMSIEELEAEAEKLNELFKKLDENALKAGLAGEITKAYDDYSESVKDLAQDHEELIGKLNEAEAAEIKHQAAIKFVTDAIADQANPAYEEWIDQNKDLIAEHESLTGKLNQLKAQGVDPNAASVKVLNEQLAINEEALAKSAEDGQILTDQLVEMADSGLTPNNEKIQELNQKLEENKQKQIAAAEEIRKTTAEFVYQQAAVGLDAGASLELARALGLIDEQSYNAAQEIIQARKEFEKTGDLDTYAGKAAAIADSLARIQSKTVTVEIDFKTRGDPSSGYDIGGIGSVSGTKPKGKAGSDGVLPGVKDPKTRQMGGNVFANQPYLVGEVGPELFVPPKSGTIIPAGSFSTPNIVINFNNTQISSELDLEVVARRVAYYINRKNQ